MTLRRTYICTDKDLKSKNFRKKKVTILAKDVDSKRKILNQNQKNFYLKKAYFLGHHNSGSCVQYNLIKLFFVTNLSPDMFLSVLA